MTLYEIDQQINEFLIFAQEQELTEDEIKDTLNSLVMDRVDKIDNIACYYKNLLSDVEALKAGKEVTGAHLEQNLSMTIK